MTDEKHINLNCFLADNYCQHNRIALIVNKTVQNTKFAALTNIKHLDVESFFIPSGLCELSHLKKY